MRSLCDHPALFNVATRGSYESGKSEKRDLEFHRSLETAGVNSGQAAECQRASPNVAKPLRGVLTTAIEMEARPTR